MTGGDALPASALTAFVVALAGVWLLARLKLPLALDRPNQRSLHSEPVPRTGGLAVLVAAAAGCAWAPWEIPAVPSAALFMLIVVSFVDDLRSLPVVIRLAAHLIAGAAAAWLLWPEQGAVIVVVAALACAWTINVFNFMDGSDGMAGGMALVGFAAYGLLSAHAGDAALAAVCFSMAGASAGFLVFNVHPARIFLGDVGSVPLGFLAGALGIVGWHRGLWSPLVPLVVFSPFLADATLTLGRRLLAGERVWQAHHDHYYQRLVRLGWGHGRTALAAWATMLGAAALAFALAEWPLERQLPWAAVWAAFLVVLLVAVEVRWRTRPPKG